MPSDYQIVSSHAAMGVKVASGRWWAATPQRKLNSEMSPGRNGQKLMAGDPRQILFEVLHEYGEGLIEDPRRFEALLRDFCPQWDWKPRVLVDVLKERVPQELSNSSSPSLALVKSQQLVERLETDLALTQEAARWAVDSWALAMGVVTAPPPPPPPQRAPPPAPPPPPQPSPPSPASKPLLLPQPPRLRHARWLWLGAIALLVLGVARLMSPQSPPPPHLVPNLPEGERHPAPDFTWQNPSDPKDSRFKPVEPVPLPPTEPNNPREQNPECLSAFYAGRADRTEWEQWFSAQTGDYREGATYWSGQRSARNPGSCDVSGSSSSREFVNGCIAAQRRLNPTDLHRNSEPCYKAGWNAYLERQPTGPSPGQGTLSPPTAPNPPTSQIRWYPKLDAPGNDLGGRDGWIRDATNADDCAQKCLADNNCVGFTYNIRRSVCIPKGRIAPLIRAEDAAITGVIIGRTELPTLPSARARVTQYPNMGAVGNDRGEQISGVNARDCKSICVADNGCAGYTYIRQSLTCIPKSFIGELSPSSQPSVTGIVESRNVSGR